MAKTKVIRRKATKEPEADAPEEYVPRLIDVAGGREIRLLAPSAVFFIEDTNGTVHLVAKDRVSNAFRRTGRDFAWEPRGFDLPPKDSGAYCTIEEIDALEQDVTDDNREQAKLALTEDERREDTANVPVRQVGQLDAPIREDEPAK